MKVTLNGFLEFSQSPDKWQDFISLCDGEAAQMGCVPLVMSAFREFHGKQVNITVELVSPDQVSPDQA